MGKTILERLCSIKNKMCNEKNERGIISLNKADKAETDIRDLSKRLGLTKMQVLILLVAMEYSADNSGIRMSNMADGLGLDYLEFLVYMGEVQGLQDKGYLMTDKEEYIYIDKSTVRSLMENKPIEPSPTTGLDTETLLNWIESILNQREKEVLTTEDAVESMRLLLDRNPRCSLSKGFQKHIFSQISDYREVMVVLGLIYRYYFEDDDMVEWHDLKDYFLEQEFSRLRARYKQRALNLQIKDIIEPSGSDGVRSRDFFKLRDVIKNDMLADVGGVRREEQKIYATNKLQASQIMPKCLFYNENEARQLDWLKKLLSENRFSEIRDKMKRCGHRTGFSCLFYGLPGTGKTESVYQIARECGRDIFIIEVSQIKSCWVGTSEKNLKGVFDEYRACVEKSGTVPILLFNEADAIFGIRQHGAEKAVDKMENSLQNIILQEMENLDGILIATTNLTQNLDKAFERRFLYKVRFDKPSTETRSKIWQSMLPELSETEALQLSRDFNFSGGQIENVARKKAVNDILSETETTYSDIRSFCEEETLAHSVSKRKIGF